MGSLLDIGEGVADAPEPKTVPADTEYKLRIIDCRQELDKNEEPYILPRFEVVDEPLAKDFTKFLRLPHEGLDEKGKVRARSALRIFLEAFSLPTSGQIDLEDMKGKTGWGILGIEDNEQYGEQNYVKKFVQPK